MLSKEDLAALREQARTGVDPELYAGKDDVKYFVNGAWTFGKLTADMKGEFHGKQGTPKRSRKGRTYRAPNGTRGYHPWNPEEVQVYRA